MADRRCVPVSASPGVLDFAAGLFASGRFGSVSEVVRAALHSLEKRELDFEKLRAAFGTKRSRTGTARVSGI